MNAAVQSTMSLLARPWARYALAVGVVAVGLLLRAALTAWVGPGLPTFVTFYPAVMVAALICGLRPGLLATLLCALAADYWLVEPAGSLKVGSLRDAVGLSLFVCMGALMSVVVDLYHRARHKAAAYDREEALHDVRREQEFLAGILEQSSQPFAVGYPDGRLGRFNRAYAALTGYTAAELRTLDWSAALTPPEWRGPEQEYLEELRRTGRPVRYEKEYVRKDGSRVPVELLVHLVRDAAGRPEYYYSFLSDTRERRRTAETARAAEERLRDLNAEMLTANATLQESRGAALNLMDDALVARREAERAVAALRQSESRYRNIFEHAGTGIAMTECGGRFVQCNSAYCAMLGYTQEELTALEFPSLIHPDDREHNLGFTGRLLAEELPSFEIENRYVHKSGAVVWVHKHVSLLRNARGQPTHIVALVNDMTARKLAEAERQKFVSLADQSSEFIGICNLDFLPIYVNEAGLRLLGVESLEHALRTPVQEFFFPEDRPFILEEFFPRVLREGRAETEIRFRHFQTGEALWMIYNVFYLRDAEGRPVGLATVSRNITERKRAEEEMRRFTAELRAANEELETSRRAAINLMDDAVEARGLAEEASAELRQNRIDLNRAQAVARVGSWRLDVQRDELLWSDENYRIFGVPMGMPLTYEMFLAAIHPEDQGYVDQQWQAALRGAPYDIEHRIVVGDRVRWVRERAELEFNDDGTLRGGFGTTQDITEKKDVEEALRQAKATAEAANEAKGRFLANVSHELRTPMNAILGMIDLALRRQIDATAQEFLGTARESAGVLLALLDDLLDSARIESGRLELESAPFSLRRVLELTARVLGVRASERGIAFRYEVADDLPDVYVGDELRLRQVLFNLAGNAVKFTERGEVAIGVRLESQDAARARLEFTVRDTGIGISPVDQERIFRPFLQADASTTRRFGGTGLGLSISTSLVAMMDGRIWVESELGRGSTFHFTVSLPWAGELVLEPEPEDVLPEVPSARLRLLLVEDNPANQKLAQFILQERGHIVDLAGEGQRAVQLVAANDYDVILMDVQMPGMDGLDATAAIRKREKEVPLSRVPIIAMTAHAMAGDRERCLAAGMDGYLSKPINGHEMIALVEQLAGRRGDLSGSRPEKDRPAAPRAGRAGEDGGSRAGDIDAVLRRTLSSAPPRPASLPESDGDGAVFNLDDAHRRCFNNPAMFQEMVGYFFKECETVFAEMRAATARSDWKELGRVGHRLKGTVVYLSAPQATEAARRVEQFGECPGDAAESEKAVAALEAECERLKAALAEHRPAGEPAA